MRHFRPCVLAAALLLTLQGVAQEVRQISIEQYQFDPAGALPADLDPDLRAPPPLAGEAHWRIIQLRAAPDRAVRERLVDEFGLELTRYVPVGAYIEHVTPETTSALEASGLVRASVAFHPGFKLSRQIGEVRYVTEERRALGDRLLLRAVLFETADLSETRQALERAAGGDLSIVGTVDDAAVGGTARITFELRSSERLTAIAHIDGIRRIEEVGEIIDQSAEERMRRRASPDSAVWKLGLTGKDQIVGIIDSGVPDLAHCFFRDDHDNTPGVAHRKIRELRDAFVSAHGTFVAGIVAGDDVNKPGTHPDRGGAWAATLVGGTHAGLTWGYKSLLAELLAARDAGAFVHTNSWYYNNGGGYDELAADVDRFTWQNENHLVIGAMAKKKVISPVPAGPPAVAKNAIAVSAAQEDPMLYGQGVDGPTADGRRKPDLMAVGCAKRSAVLPSDEGSCLTELYGSSVCATSAAAPEAAAAAVLARQYFVDGWYPSGSPDPCRSQVPSGALLKAVLVNSARDMSGVPGYPNDTEGWGVITLERTLFFPGSSRDLHVWEERNASAQSLYTGESRKYTMSVTDSQEPLKVTLVWTAPPGAPNANDLDLKVVAPGDAATYYGNQFSGGLSVPGVVTDRLNNVEQVLIDQPAVGEWTILVEGTAVYVGAPGQGYAVVATGLSRPGAMREPDRI